MKPTPHKIALAVTRPKPLQRHRKKGTQTKPGKAKNVKFEASEVL